MSWQPIETAPKDRTRILGWNRDWQQSVIVRWAVSEPFGKEPTWTTDSEGPGYSSGFDEGEITHWMPLPEPPCCEDSASPNLFQPLSSYW